MSTLPPGFTSTRALTEVTMPVFVSAYTARRTGGDAVARDEDVVAADEPLVAPEGVVEVSGDRLAEHEGLRLGLRAA